MAIGPNDEVIKYKKGARVEHTHSPMCKRVELTSSGDHQFTIDSNRSGSFADVSLEFNSGTEGGTATGLESLPKEYATGSSGSWGAIFNFVNTIVGAGIIGLPFAIYQCGFVTGCALMLLAAFLTNRSAIMLVVSGERAGRLNYEELMELAFGSAGFHAFCFFAFVMAFGAMTAYLIIIGDTVPHIARAAAGEGQDGGVFGDRQSVIALFSILVILPLSCLRDMHKLAFSSFLSVIADSLLTVIVLVSGPSESRAQNIDRSKTFTIIRPTVFAGFGAISFAFVCQSSTFLVYRTLKRPSVAAWTGITRSSLIIALSMCLVLALSGYLSFVDQTEGDVLNNFGSTHMSASVARGFLAVTMVFTYPMEIFVARHVLDAALLQKVLGLGPITRRRHVGITALVWLLSTVVALSTKDLGVVLEFFGAFAASAIGYIMPAVLYLQTHRLEVSQCLSAWRKGSPEYVSSFWGRCQACRPFWTAWFMAAFGSVAMVAGVAGAIHDATH